MKPTRNELEVMIGFRREQTKDYCGTCGGLGEIRVGIFGGHKTDFETCPDCRGRGIPQRLKTSAYEEATQCWRKEFEPKTARSS